MYKKAIIALVGAIVVWATTYAPSGYTHWLQLLVGILSAAGVYATPNSPAQL